MAEFDRYDWLPLACHPARPQPSFLGNRSNTINTQASKIAHLQEQCGILEHKLKISEATARTLQEKHHHLEKELGDVGVIEKAFNALDSRADALDLRAVHMCGVSLNALSQVLYCFSDCLAPQLLKIGRSCR